MKTFTCANIENVKAGDIVIVCSPYSVKTVEKVTEVLKASYKTDLGKKFNKYGTTPGDGWSKSVAYLYDEEWAKEILRENRRNNVINTLKKNKWEEMSDEVLNEVMKLVKPEIQRIAREKAPTPVV